MWTLPEAWVHYPNDVMYCAAFTCLTDWIIAWMSWCTSVPIKLYIRDVTNYTFFGDYYRIIIFIIYTYSFE